MTIPATAVLTWSELEPKYTALDRRDLDPDNSYQFLLDWSDVEKEVEELQTYLTLAVDLNTADEEANDKLVHFNQVTRPKITIANAELRKKVLAVTEPDVPAEAVLVLKRMGSDSAAYRLENVPLEAEQAHLVTRYSRLTGSQLVNYDGEKLTIPAIQEKLRDVNRGIRERAWQTWQRARLQLSPQLDELFLKLFAVRTMMARKAGFKNYRDLVWLNYHRYDYTAEQCYEFHESIAKEVVPFASELLEIQRKGLGVEVLKPWDFYWRSPVDPYNRKPLRPFRSVAELENGMQRIFTGIDLELGQQFERFRQGFVDLGSRPNKMSHAYCVSFPKRGMPFVLENVVGSENDVRITLHEFGHAFHGYASMQAQPLVWNHFAATEFVEVPSQAMEVLALPFLHRKRGGFYDDEELARVYWAQISQIVHLLSWIGFMDSMQHWLYAELSAAPSVGRIDAKARELIARFMPQTDWSGFERELEKVWHYHHMFTSPFYYIEYGLSWLGALQVWRNSLQDPRTALAKYKAALRLGNSSSVPELFEAVGARFAFDVATIRELMQFLRGELKNVTPIAPTRR
jgi:oligoendopeptidase F